MKRMLQVAGLIVVALAGYLAFWPVPIEPVAWQAPPSTGYTGPHALNRRLGAVQVVSVAPEIGPEHIDFGPDGKLYTGVLSGDERHLFVAETGEYRIWKVGVSGRDLDAKGLAGGDDARARVIAAKLPGFPDNLTRSTDGRLWTGLTKPRSAAVDGMAGRPWLRALTLRLPRSLWPVPPAYGHVIAFDEDGRVVADLQDPSGRVAETSGVTEYGGRLYVHSLHAGALGVIDAAAAGLAPPRSPEGLEPVERVP